VAGAFRRLPRPVCKPTRRNADSHGRQDNCCVRRHDPRIGDANDGTDVIDDRNRQLFEQAVGSRPVTMSEDAPSPSEIRRLLWRSGGWVVALFWLVQLVELSLTSFVEGTQRSLGLLAPRILIVAAGMILSVPVIEVAALGAGGAFGRRLLTTVFTALAMCIALMAVDYMVYFIPFPAGRLAFDLTEFVYSGFGWSWFFLGLAGAVVALSYSVEMRDRERRLALLSVEARDARLAALRYQLNPHFLFNTLNSIAALIDDGEKEPAETMVVNLAEFLRATLELDPVIDIRLSREVELQALYLSIEETRFPARLRTHYDIDDAVAGALVPALITQPIVENAIRHAVARSSVPVTVTIAAIARHGRLRLTIADNGRAKGDAMPGTGVGMANVRARLENRFGRAQSLDAVRDAAGFRVVLELPLRFVA